MDVNSRHAANAFLIRMHAAHAISPHTAVRRDGLKPTAATVKATTAKYDQYDQNYEKRIGVHGITLPAVVHFSHQLWRTISKRAYPSKSSTMVSQVLALHATAWPSKRDHWVCFLPAVVVLDN